MIQEKDEIFSSCLYIIDLGTIMDSLDKQDFEGSVLRGEYYHISSPSIWKIYPYSNAVISIFIKQVCLL